MPDSGLTKLRSDRTVGYLSYYPEYYDNGRFRVAGELARAGQGYTLLVEDTWCGGPAVLKGMWWKEIDLQDPRRAAQKLAENNADLLNGLHAARQATQLSQQAPAVVAVVRESSPALRFIGFPQELEEYFVVHQFVGSQWSPAPTLSDVIAQRAAGGARFTELELLDLADQLCSTVAAVHAKRRAPGGDRPTLWIHSDLKPENVLVLGPPWRYVLIDYDGAVERGEPIPTSTEGYAPPERRGESNRERDKATEKFDIYLLGTTLAHAAGLGMLDDDSRWLLYGSEDEHGRGKQRIKEFGYGPILTTIISSCLAEPSRRLGSVGAVQTDLGRARDNALLSELLT